MIIVQSAIRYSIGIYQTLNLGDLVLYISELLDYFHTDRLIPIPSKVDTKFAGRKY